jgi:hypothetical protein
MKEPECELPLNRSPFAVVTVCDEAKDVVEEVGEFLVGAVPVRVIVVEDPEGVDEQAGVLLHGDIEPVVGVGAGD